MLFMAGVRKLGLGLVQMAAGPDAVQNFNRAIEFVEQAARGGAALVCLPELFRSQYFCQREDAKAFDLAETVPGPTTAALGEVARRYSITIIAPVFERRAPGIYHNSAAMIGPAGEIVGLYRKMHIPDDPAYYEKYYFTPGDLGFPTFETPAGRFATLICWDQWFPEAARLATLEGAVVLFYPTAIGWHPEEKEVFGRGQRDAWRTIQRAHAIANAVYVVAVNRVGLEKLPDAGPGIEFWGSSFVADPFGVILAEAAPNREEMLMVEIDLDRVEEVRRNWPFLRDRRVDAYAGLNRRLLDEKLK